MKTTVAETRQGRVRGKVGTGSTFFGGIPYAAAPVGALRFAPPQPPPAWTGVREALRSGPSAPQLAVTKLGPIGRISRFVRGPMDEDCLTLNLSTPAVDQEKRPVLVWFHGGAFVLGAGSTFLYDPSTLVESGNVVVVSPNYRLGALGFLDLSAFGADEPTANLGLRDQIAALEWVRDNIDRFGGDPQNVTVFGESAGAMSLAVHLGSGRQLFRRAILQSGAAANVSEAEEAAYVSEQFLSAVDVPDGDLERLRQLPLSSILKAQSAALRGRSHRMGRLPWQPTVDGELLARHPLESIREGSTEGIEVLIGTNLDEWKLFTSASLALRAMGFGELERRIARGLARNERSAVAPDLVARLYRDLTHRRGTRETAYEAWVAFRTDEFFRAPAIELANALASGGSRVFMYRFDLPVPAFRRSLGACHAAEVPLVFGTQKTKLLRPLYLGSRKANRLAEVLQQAWLSFALSGRPADSQSGEWPVYDPKSYTVQMLGPSSVFAKTNSELTTRGVWFGPELA